MRGLSSPLKPVLSFDISSELTDFVVSPGEALYLMRIKMKLAGKDAAFCVAPGYLVIPLFSA